MGRQNPRQSWTGLGLAAACLVVGGLSWWTYSRVERTGTGEQSSDSSAESSRSADEVDDPLEQAGEFYDSRPYYQQPQPHKEVPEGLPDLSAETCGECHEEIYREWKISTHRRAWTQDPQFMAEFDKSRRGGHAGEKQDDVSWMCVTCHTPTVNQIEKLVVGLEDGNIGRPKYVQNPTFSSELQHEAITCASCHVSDGVVYGPWGDTDAPHPTAKDPTLRKSDQCTQCHQANAKWPSRNLACFFDTGKQFEASKYASQGKRCQSCHMPEVERKLAEDFDVPKRETRRHWFGGSLIPKQPKYREEIEELESVYGSGATLEVLEAGAVDELRTSSHGRLETSSCSNEPCRRIVVRVTNSRAGHWLPTGDPERHIDIRAVVRGDGGDELAVAEQRVASKYEWWPEIEKQYDNRLKPDESIDVVVHVPADAETSYVDVVARKYRMYPEAFEHHELEGEYVRGREFHRSSWRVDADEAPERAFLKSDRKQDGEPPEGAFAHHPSTSQSESP